MNNIKNNIQNENDHFFINLKLDSEKDDWAKTYYFSKLIINNINSYLCNPKNILNNVNINGSWGTGKSTISYKIHSHYEKKENNIYSKIFNLWNYEIYDNPFLKIIIDICNFFKINKTKYGKPFLEV